MPGCAMYHKPCDIDRSSQNISVHVQICLIIMLRQAYFYMMRLAHKHTQKMENEEEKKQPYSVVKICLRKDTRKCVYES